MKRIESPLYVILFKALQQVVQLWSVDGTPRSLSEYSAGSPQEKLRLFCRTGMDGAV